MRELQAGELQPGGGGVGNGQLELEVHVPVCQRQRSLAAGTLRLHKHEPALSYVVVDTGVWASLTHKVGWHLKLEVAASGGWVGAQ